MSSLDPYSLDLLVRTMYGEAAGEGPTGQAAVGHVILNRLKQGDRYGGSTVRDVVMAPKQFEPWGNPTARKRMMALDPSSPKYQELAQIAQGVATGDVPDPTGGATHFANEAIVRQRRGGGVAPWMAKMADTARKIGNHTFYGGGSGPVDPSGLPPGAASTPSQGMPAPPAFAQQYKSGSPPPPPAWAQQFASPPTMGSMAAGATPPPAPPPAPTPKPDVPGGGMNLGAIASLLGSMAPSDGGGAAAAPPPAPRGPGQDTLGPLLAQYMQSLQRRS